MLDFYHVLGSSEPHASISHLSLVRAPSDWPARWVRGQEYGLEFMRMEPDDEGWLTRLIGHISVGAIDDGTGSVIRVS
jgi:hypothetical protein